MRIRTIKPGFFRSDDVTPLSYRARLTWIGLWTYVDDEGRGKDDARIIKGDIWTLEDDVTWRDVEDDLIELERNDRIVRYEVDGKRYLAVRKWHEHQVVSRATASKLPEPPHPLTEDSVSTPGPLPAGSGRGRGSGTGNEEEETEPPLTAASDLTPPPLPLVEVDPGPGFDDFWDVYPRGADKPAARRAWDKAIKRARPEVILAGAVRYRDDPNRVAQFTKHPGPWLNAEAWNDPPLPDRRGSGPPREAPSDRIRNQRDTALAALDRIAQGAPHGNTPRMPRPALDARPR